MLFKGLVILLLLTILISLGTALRYLLQMKRTPQNRDRMAKALTVRISVSIFLFFLLLAAYFFGWISPHGI